MKIRATYITRSKIYINKPEMLTNYFNIHGIGLLKHFCSHVIFFVLIISLLIVLFLAFAIKS